MACRTRRSPRSSGSRWRRRRCDCTAGASACATSSTTTRRPTPGGTTVRCDEVARILPEAVDNGAAVELSVQRHIDSCLRCQAELARYRRMLRGLQLLRTRYLEPAPGLLAQTLAAIEEAGERQAVRSILSGRRLAYVGAIGGAAVAAGTAATVMLRHRSS